MAQSVKPRSSRKPPRRPSLPADYRCCLCNNVITNLAIEWVPRQRRYAHLGCELERRNPAKGAARKAAATRAANTRAAAAAAQAAVESPETADIRRLITRAKAGAAAG
jgi:hypothetical protein